MSGADSESDEISDGSGDAPTHDNALLAELLATQEHDLIAAIGGPWHQLRDADVDASTMPQREFLFLGRTGPSALLAFDASLTDVLVGQVVGEWVNPGTLKWGSHEPTASVPIGDAWLENLAVAIDAAYHAKKDSLVNCRYCGGTYGPEFAFDRECCSSCVSRYFRIVF